MARLNEGRRVLGASQCWSTNTAHVVLPYKLNRGSWPIVPTAPWDGEPDAILWQHSHNVSLLIARSPVNGVLCGYACVPLDHYMWGQEVSDFALRWEWYPHGGMNFAGEFSSKVRADIGLAVLDGAWWFGFDCGHVLDCAPKHPAMGGTYSDFDYVIGQLEKLGTALATPIEQTTQAARVAWSYAGESLRSHIGGPNVRWLGTNGTEAEPFTRLDVEDYIASWSGALTKEPEDQVRCAFTTLVKLIDGRFALVEAATPHTDWSDSAGVAKVCYDLEKMRTYLARSNDRRVDLEMIHRGRREMLAPLESYCRKNYDPGIVFGLKRKDIEEADRAFELAEEP